MRSHRVSINNETEGTPEHNSAKGNHDVPLHHCDKLSLWRLLQSASPRRPSPASPLWLSLPRHFPAVMIIAQGNTGRRAHSHQLAANTIDGAPMLSEMTKTRSTLAKTYSSKLRGRRSRSRWRCGVRRVNMASKLPHPLSL